MKSFNWKFFILALLGTAGLIGIGIGIAEGSTLIITSAIVLAIVSVTTGFTLKYKLNKK
ncbi:MAG: YlaF family protein [Bacillus sp. (in: Bacteria)]|nr:YlaF family protein [Bacillus sp. (in: firmicutes)]